MLASFLRFISSPAGIITLAGLITLCDIAHSVTVGGRIAPPTAATERSMKLSPHAAPQYSNACHAYLVAR
jgi:hypothetical protein